MDINDIVKLSNGGYGSGLAILIEGEKILAMPERPAYIIDTICNRTTNKIKLIEFKVYNSKMQIISQIVYKNIIIGPKFDEKSKDIFKTSLYSYSQCFTLENTEAPTLEWAFEWEGATYRISHLWNANT